MNPLWKKPARLWRRRERTAAAPAEPPVAQIASGSLEDMVLRAIARGGAVHEREALFIDVDAEQMFAWADIRALHNSPEFPIEI